MRPTACALISTLLKPIKVSKRLCANLPRAKTTRLKCRMKISTIGAMTKVLTKTRLRTLGNLTANQSRD